MKTFDASIIQLRAGPDKASNLAAAAEAVGRAAGEGAELIALPEVATWRGPKASEVATAEPIPGASSEFFQALAAKHRVHLVAGSLLELAPGNDDERVFNTCCLFGPDGNELARYRKIHLFDVDLPGRVSISESDTRRAGSKVVKVATELGNIGLAICYDLRFPELFRALAKNDEACGPADVVVMPSAFTRPTGQAHWEPLVRARAIENQVFFLAPNQFGRALEGFEDHGHSLAVDPWGRILGEGPPDEPAVITVRLDATQLETARREIPCLGHRRLAP